MKKVIYGKLYDTESAKFLADRDNGCFPNEMDYCYEALYQKRTGEFFLYGTGGARSKYSKMTRENSWSGDTVIKPIAAERAVQWVEKYASEKYEEIFGDVVEDDTKKVVVFSLKTSTDELITRLAREKGCTRSEIVDLLVEAAAARSKE